MCRGKEIGGTTYCTGERRFSPPSISISLRPRRCFLWNSFCLVALVIILRMQERPTSRRRPPRLSAASEAVGRGRGCRRFCKSRDILRVTGGCNLEAGEEARRARGRVLRPPPRPSCPSLLDQIGSRFTTLEANGGPRRRRNHSLLRSSSPLSLRSGFRNFLQQPRTFSPVPPGP